MSAETNIAKYERALNERAKKPLFYRFVWHGSKGNIRRWFPEYAQRFPDHIRQNPHKNKHLPNVLPERRKHFCNFLDERRREWSAQNLCAQSIAEEPYRDPGTPLLEPDEERHQRVLIRLQNHRIGDVIRQKWLKANPDHRSPSGKRVKTGMTHHFDRYALWIISRLDASVSAEFAEAQRQAEIFRTSVEARLAAENERRRLVKEANTRRHEKNLKMSQQRKKAEKVKRRILAMWERKYGHLFRDKPSIQRGRQKHSRIRRAIYAAGKAVDPKVCDKVSQIQMGPTVCHWCAKPLPFGGTVDHIVPVAKGGQHICRNIVAACWPCNREKKDTMPDSPQMPVGVHLELALV